MKNSAELDLAIQFGRGVRIRPLTEARVRTIARACLEGDFALTIRFVTRSEAKQLNEQFRGRTYVPNVLTFSYLPEPCADIVICTWIVRRQAEDQGKRYAEHLTHLIVHGMLHAQGYDHETPASSRRMEGCEKRILAKLGLPDPYLPRPGK